MADVSEPVGDWGLLLDLRRGTGTTLYAQLEGRLRELVRSGRLAPESRLPSTRALARAVGVSRGTVLEAYGQLVADGYLAASPGAPTRVAASAVAERPPLRAGTLTPPAPPGLLPGVPDLAAFPRESWMRSLRAALREAPLRALADPDPRGTPELRDALMDYLLRARAAAPEPEHVLIGAGITQALSLLCQTLAARGIERIAVEAPGWPRHRMVAERAGLEVVEVAVDREGMIVEGLAATDCEVVILTPAHQYPTGVVLSAERRAELLAWAEECDGLIVEDDYDSELRYDRSGVGALQGLAPERVCHLGSVSARLAPGLRLGWTLSPSWLTGALAYEAAVAGATAPVLDQLALADLITRGELDRHLRRMRARYAPLRQTLLQRLGEALPDAAVGGVAAGLFIPVTLGSGGQWAAALALAGVGEALAPNGEDGPDLLLGFAGLSESAIADGVRRLAAAVTRAPEG